MKVPEAFTDDCDLGMCYEKKVIMNDQVFFGQLMSQVDVISVLLQSMRSCNKTNKHKFPFYQLRVRPARWYESKVEAICFELRWGNREELQNENLDSNCPTTEGETVTHLTPLPKPPEV